MTARARTAAGLLRPLLAAVVCADLLSFYLFIADARDRALAGGAALHPLVDAFSRPGLVAAVIALGLLGAVAFARRPGGLPGGLLALAALTLLSTIHTRLFSSPWRHLFFSGLCLTGWLLGLAVQRWRGRPDDESLARVGSVALLGAAYLNSGISKMVFGGIEWMSGYPVQAAIIGQQGLIPDGLAHAYRSWMVATPAAAGLLASATVAFELCGPLMLLGGRIRLLVALALCFMHATIYVLTAHILYWESIVLLLAFGLSADETPAAGDDAAAAPLTNDRVFAAGAATLALCAVVAIGRQARRHASLSEAGMRVEAPPAFVPTTAPLRRVGPFVVGQPVADGWSIESIQLLGEGLVVALVGEPGRARFEITCEAREYDSPFDVGAAHVFYPNDIELRDLESSGRALQAKLRDAAGGEDVCVRLRSWHAAARAGEGR